MNALLRVFIGLVVSLVIFGSIIHFTHMRRDAFLPPSWCLNDIEWKVAPGTVTGTYERGYGDHWWAGVDYRWYVGYKFFPDTPEVQPDGTVKYVPGTKEQDGEVRVTQADYDNKYHVGDPISVSYDPFNTPINGVHGTMGGLSKTAGDFSGWIKWPIGIIFVGILIGEFLKRWIKQGDI